MTEAGLSLRGGAWIQQREGDLPRVTPPIMVELALEPRPPDLCRHHQSLWADHLLSEAYHIKSRLLARVWFIGFLHTDFVYAFHPPPSILGTHPIHAGQLTLPQTCLVLPHHRVFAASIPSHAPANSDPKSPLNCILKTSEPYSVFF